MIQSDEVSAELIVFWNVKKLRKHIQSNSAVRIGHTYLANESGLPKSKWAALSKGPQNMTIRTLRMIAKGLGCTEAELLDRRKVIGGVDEL